MGKLFGLFPTPPALKARARVYDLKARLDWGEPALTIVDVRDRGEFNHSHIQGAISMPAKDLVQQALRSLALDRDIYLYSDADEDTSAAATQLRAAGFRQVAELQGGLPAWKAVGFPIERGVLVAG